MVIWRRNRNDWALRHFLLIHMVPWVCRQLSPGEVEHQQECSADTTSWKSAGIVEAAAQAATLAIVIWLMFGMGVRLYIGFIPIIWIAMRHGVRRVVTGLLAFNFGVVIALHFYPPRPDLFTSVGPLMFVLSAAGLVVGSEVSERQRIATTVKEQATYLDSLIQNSPLGVVALDQDGYIELANEAFGKLFLCEPSEAITKNLCELFPLQKELQSTSSLPELAFPGQNVKNSIRRQRRDGKLLSLELQTVPLITNGLRRG